MIPIFELIRLANYLVVLPYCSYTQKYNQYVPLKIAYINKNIWFC
jgi:hypothetical protein